MKRDALEHVVELALGELSPSAADKARHRAALGLGPAGAPRSPAASKVKPSPSGAGGWRALRASGSAGWSAAALLLGAGVSLGFWLRGAVAEREPSVERDPQVVPAMVPSPHEPPPAPPPVAAPAPAPEPPEEGAASEPATVARAAERERTIAKPQRPALNGAGADAAGPARPLPFEEELALLQRVERALRASNASLALVLLGELDQRFPHTRLGEEREAARRIAECQLHLPGWQQRAERFLLDQSSSVYAQRVRAACTSERAKAREGEKAPASADTPAR